MIEVKSRSIASAALTACLGARRQSTMSIDSSVIHTFFLGHDSTMSEVDSHVQADVLMSYSRFLRPAEMLAFRG
jgi:hypothetical protein